MSLVPVIAFAAAAVIRLSKSGGGLPACPDRASCLILRLPRLGSLAHHRGVFSVFRSRVSAGRFGLGWFSLPVSSLWRKSAPPAIGKTEIAYKKQRLALLGEGCRLSHCLPGVGAARMRPGGWCTGTAVSLVVAGCGSAVGRCVVGCRYLSRQFGLFRRKFLLSSPGLRLSANVLIAWAVDVAGRSACFRGGWRRAAVDADLGGRGPVPRVLLGRFRMRGA